MIYFLEIFSQNLKLFGQKFLFSVRSMLILQKNLQKISIFVKNFWPVWPVNFLLLTRLTRNIFPFDPPTRWKIVGWPVTRPDPWNFQICWPDPTRPVENLLLPDPTRPVATRSIPSTVQFRILHIKSYVITQFLFSISNGISDQSYERIKRAMSF